MREYLEDAGWVVEPVLEGAESEISGVSPAACEPLFGVLDRGKEDRVTGFRNEKRGSYLLIRDWPSGQENLPRSVLEAAEMCPRMAMGYDSTKLAYTVMVVLREEKETRLLLTARESDALVTEMLVSASTGSGENRLVRVMNPRGIAKPEQDAMDLAANR
ncbi:hypothetical protein HRW07_25325 [Streptomyces lunaelactis]|nr:hypothetical protein [Streptomyces lunaelactis]